MEQKKVCQVCGMPMDSEAVMGTEADGSKNSAYCVHCYKDGAMVGAHKPFCQSCAMPMESDEMKGTEADGSKSAEYCVYCYKGGAFTKPDATMEEMIEICVPHMAPLSPDEARARMQQYFPQLKRWRA